MSRFLALKFGYEGTHFSGFQRQPDIRTVEGDIREALFRLEKDMGERGRRQRGTPDEGNPFSYRYASRTDKGVSALGNVLVLRSDTAPSGGPAPESLITYLNDSLENITFHGYDEVDETFNPRHASERWYRYIFPTMNLPQRFFPPDEKHIAQDIPNAHHGISAFRKIIPFDPELARKAARTFVGTHDFSGFAKLEPGKDPVRTITSFDISLKPMIEGLPPAVVIDIRGESFLWMMVRFLVGGILKVLSGDWSRDELGERLEHPDPERKPSPVRPDQLILMDVTYPGTTFTRVREDPVRHLDGVGRLSGPIELARMKEQERKG
jgi:tRNA pseudouridine38-40 synthase